jgi:hypothetical protein
MIVSASQLAWKRIVFPSLDEINCLVRRHHQEGTPVMV